MDQLRVEEIVEIHDSDVEEISLLSNHNFTYPGLDIYDRFYTSLSVDDPLNSKKKKNAHLCTCGVIRTQNIRNGYANLREMHVKDYLVVVV